MNLTLLPSRYTIIHIKLNIFLIVLLIILIILNNIIFSEKNRNTYVEKVIKLVAIKNRIP